MRVLPYIFFFSYSFAAFALPVITEQPAALTEAEPGSSVTLSVTASGESLSYQWQKYLPSAGWQIIPGATGSSYTATYNDINDSASLAVDVMNATGTAYSDTGLVVVAATSERYLIVETKMTWSAAKAYAESQGGYLLEINSYGEWLHINTFLQNFISDTFVDDSEIFTFLDSTLAPDGGGSAYLWLGGSDAALEGDWRWASSGEQFWSGDKNGTAMNGSFNAWGNTGQQNEPDNYQGNQDALALALETWPNVSLDLGFELGYTYDWNDVRADNELYFIIEKDLVDAPIWELYDDFSGATMDTQKWDFAYWDGGNLPTLSNGRALLSGNTVNSWNATQVTEAMLQVNGNAANLVSGGEAHSILEFKDSDSILGIEMELTLPVGVSDNVGIGLYAIDYEVMFNSPTQDPVIFSLDLWNSSSFSLPEVQITWRDPFSGTEQKANGVPVNAGQTVLLKFERTEDTIRFFVDDIQVAESSYSSSNETFMIRAVSEDGYNFLANVDNVRVLRDTTSVPSLPVIESYGNTDLLEDSSGYYAGSADTPLLYSGTQVSPTYPSASFTAVGVDEVNGSYRLVLTNGSQYYAANFSLSGNSITAWAVVSNILAEEVNLQQDLDGDGHVGTPPIEPPAEIEGMQFEYTSTDNVTSVPYQEFYGSDGLAAYGFSNSSMNQSPYTYSDGVISFSFSQWNEEIRLTFTSANTGTYAFFEVYGEEEYLDDSGTFSIVTPSLEDKTDWQHTETFDSGFSTDYWNISHDLEDRVEVASGALNFIFAGADEEDIDGDGNLNGEYVDYEIHLDYSRALPMDESWQIVMDDVYASNSLEDFEFEIELEFEGQYSSFQCGFEFQNSWQGGSGNSIDAFYYSTTQGIDINGDGVIQTVPYAMDLDGDGIIRSGNEDVDGDGFFDIDEDLNGDGLLNNGGTGGAIGPGGPATLLPGEGPLLNEDANNNGLLDLGEDLNGNGVLDTAINEDVDGDGNLDYNEDLDLDGFFDIWDETNINENVTRNANGSASVSTTEDSRIQSNVSLRITHNANSRELVFEYQPDGVNEWSELARLNLGSGDFSSLNSIPTQGYGELIGTSQRMELYLEVEAEETTQAGDLKIGGIEIGNYTPPPPPASPESLVGYKLVGQFNEASPGIIDTYRHDFFFTDSETMQGHYFVESNDPSSVDDWSEETYTYQKTGATTGTVAITNSSGETTDVVLTFDSATSGTALANGRNGNRPNSASGPFTFVPYDPSELPEPPLPVIESYGNTDLLEDSSGYYAGSADTPLLYSGTQVSPTYPNPAFTAVGVDKVNGSYRLVLTNGSQYYAANFSLSGNSITAWAVVSNILAEEVNLQQDFDGDGHVGTPPIEPPAEIEGMQFEYTSTNGFTSVPYQEFYGSDGLVAHGFSNSSMNQSPYTYSDGVISFSFSQWNEEIRLTFTSANTGTYAFFEVYGEEEYLDDSGTFSIVTPSLEDKTDWQHTETFDSGFSTDYWNISHDLEDRVEVASGALNFIFAGADEEDIDGDGNLNGEYVDYEIHLDYSRALPMDESWQIVMDDVYASNSLEDFQFVIELEFEGQYSSFQCGFEFQNSWQGGSGNSIDAFYYSTTQGIDINGDGVIQTVPYAMDLDGDGIIRSGNEDVDGDGFFDIDEDLNGDGLLNNGGTGGAIGPGGPATLLPGEGPLLNEDANNNGLLDLGEDLNGNGVLDTAINEDVDGDGNLDYNEDLDLDGFFDIWDETNINENVTRNANGSASVSTTEDSRIQSNVSLRITHNANSRELVFEYQPDGVNEWSELARLNLGSGDFSSLNSIPTQGYGELIGTSQRMELYLEVEAEETTQAGDLKIGGIEIGNYTPPPPPASPESLVGYKLVGQFNEASPGIIDTYRHDFFFTDSETMQGHYFVESNDPSSVDDWSEETYTYQKTGATTGTVAITNSSGETTDVVLTFDSATSGTALANGRNGNRPNSASGPFTFVPYDPSELPEPPLPVIESYGNTDLLEDSSGYYAGSADTPLLYSGTQVSPTYPNPAFTAVGVDKVNGSYRLVLTNGSQYYAANFSLSGNSITAWAVVSNILAEEVNLQQDFDGDGHVGTPPIEPPAEIEGMQFEYTSTDNVTSVPYQEFYGSDGLAAYGFSNSIIERYPYTYFNGVISYPEWDEEIRLTFTSANTGTYAFFEVYGEEEYLDDSGTFSIVTPSLEDKTDWQYTEDFDSPLSNDYWQVDHRSEDSLTYDGDLSFIFGNSTQDSYSDTDVAYARTLPMDEDWQVVLDDIYAAPGLSYFKIELELLIASPEFECQLSFRDYGVQGNGREFGVFLEQWLPSGDSEYASAYVSASEDTRISSGGDMRIVHVASSRNLIFEYQPYGASNWSELARLNLESGSFEGENGYTSIATGGLISSTDNRMAVEIGAEASVATQVGDLKIDSIEIGNYTPPPTPVDSDGDGLDDSVETNTGTYVSPTNTGTNPQLVDSSGDGFTDYEAVNASVDPNSDYSGLLNVVRQDPERFGIGNIGLEPGSIVDMQMGSVGLERGTNGNFNMNFDLEISADLQTWTPHSSETIEISVPDQSKTFMRLNVK